MGVYSDLLFSLLFEYILYLLKELTARTARLHVSPAGAFLDKKTGLLGFFFVAPRLKAVENKMKYALL